ERLSRDDDFDGYGPEKAGWRGIGEDRVGHAEGRLDQGSIPGKPADFNLPTLTLVLVQGCLMSWKPGTSGARRASPADPGAADCSPILISVSDLGRTILGHSAVAAAI